MNASTEIAMLLIMIFFIREMYMITTSKPNDYDTGYKDAVKDIAEIWNHSDKRKCEFSDKMKIFFKDNGWG